MTLSFTSKFSNRCAYKAYFTVVLMGFIISLLYTSPFVTSLSNDKEIYRYIAMLVSKGLVPYRDVFDIKPPLVYFITAPFAGNEWSFWFLFGAVVSVSGIAFYKIVISIGTKYPYLCTAIYFLLLRFPRIAEGGQLTYELTAAFTTIIVFLYVFRKNHSLILLGMLLAVVFFTQQNDVLCLLPVAFYAIFSRRAEKYKNQYKCVKQLVINSTLVGFGFMGVVFIISAYFLYHGAFIEFINDVFLFVPRYYAGSGGVHSVAAMFFRTCKLLLWTGLLPISLIVVIYNIYFVMRDRFTDHRMRSVVFITTFAMVLAIISANISGHYYPHYLLGYSAYLAIQIAIFASFIGDKKVYGLFGWLLVFGVIVLSSFFLWEYKINELRKQGMIFHATSDKISAVYHSMTHSAVEPYKRMVSDVKGNDGQLYIIGNIHVGIFSINSDLRIVAPSKWVGDIYIIPDVLLAKGEIKSAIIDRIEQNKTKYIFDFTSDTTFRLVADKKLWQQMLDKFYVKRVPLVWDGVKGWLYVRQNSGELIPKKNVLLDRWKKD